MCQVGKLTTVHLIWSIPTVVDPIADNSQWTCRYTATIFTPELLLSAATYCGDWGGRSWGSQPVETCRRGERFRITFVHKIIYHQQSSIKLSTNHPHSPWSQVEGRCRSGSHVAAGGQTEPTPSCPVDSLPPLDHLGYLGKPGGRVALNRFQDLKKNQHEVAWS